jgi:hypothetical protein
MRGIHFRDGSQKSTTSNTRQNHQAEVSASGNANGDVKEHRDLADSSNEDVIQLY